MAKTIQEVMTVDPTSYPAGPTVADAARAMRGHGRRRRARRAGRRPLWIVTDRDVVVRIVAEGLDPSRVAVGDICSSDLVALSPSDRVEDAVLVGGKARKR